MSLPEGGKKRREPAIGKRLRRGDPETAAQAMIATGYVTVERERFVLHALRAHRYPGTRLRCHVEASRKPLEQPHTKPRLQRLQATKSGGMIDTESNRRRRQATGALDGKYKPKFVPIVHTNRIALSTLAVMQVMLAKCQ